MTTVNRSDVLRGLSQARLDVNQISPEAAAALEKAGVTREKLREIAGKDGVIAGRAEARALYDVVEEQDHSGSKWHLKTHEKAANGKEVLTASGKVYEALREQIDQQRVAAHLGGPAAAQKSPKGAGAAQKRMKAVDKALAVLGALAGPPVRMETKVQYPGLKGVVFEVSFDRPVTRQDVARHLYQGGAVPTEYDTLGKAGAPYANGPDPSRRPLLEPDGRQESPTRWRIQLPDHSVAWTRLNPGIEEQLLAAPRLSVPPWVSAASRAAIETKSPPQPGDPRFSRVKNDFPAPRQNVTVWREGDLVYRLDTQSGAVSGFRYSQDRYIGLHNRLLERYVEKEGMDLSPALDRIEQEVGDNNLRAILMFVLGSVG